MFDTAPLAVGDTVQLAPKLQTDPRYKSHLKLLGEVRRVTEGPHSVVIEVLFDNGTETGLTMSLFQNCLQRAEKAQAKTATARRPAFFLHEPRDDRSEKQKQDDGIKWLQHPDRGYKVLVVGQYMRKVQCTAEGCGNWFWPKGFGNTVGYPDLTIYHPTRWGKPGTRRPVLLVEYKKDENADRKPRQIELASEGVSAFVWSLPLLLWDIFAFERDVLGVVPHPEIADYVARHSEYLSHHGRGPLMVNDDTNELEPMK